MRVALVWALWSDFVVRITHLCRYHVGYYMASIEWLEEDSRLNPGETGKAHTASWIKFGKEIGYFVVNPLF